MAKAVVEGASAIHGIDVELAYHVNSETLGDYDALIFGAPTYHHNMPMDLKMLFEEAAAKGVNLKAKIGGAFGSYGWSGEAPKLVLEILKNKFEMQVIEPPLLIRYSPDEAGLKKCIEFGRKIAERLMQ